MKLEMFTYSGIQNVSTRLIMALNEERPRKNLRGHHPNFL